MTLGIKSDVLSRHCLVGVPLGVLEDIQHALAVAVLMVDPENQPPQYSAETALEIFDKTRKDLERLEK